jgi:bacterioferritin-associated ferredoxin
MWVCSCNAFDDKALDEAIKRHYKKPANCCSGETPSGHKRPSLCQVYKEASGGKAAVCGSCIPRVKKAISEHKPSVK